MTEAFQLLTEAFVKDCMSRPLVLEWHKWFRKAGKCEGWWPPRSSKHINYH